MRSEISKIDYEIINRKFAITFMYKGTQRVLPCQDDIDLCLHLSTCLRYGVDVLDADASTTVLDLVKNRTEKQLAELTNNKTEKDVCNETVRN